MVNRAAIGEKILTEYFLSKKESYIRINATTDTEVNRALKKYSITDPPSIQAKAPLCFGSPAHWWAAFPQFLKL